MRVVILCDGLTFGGRVWKAGDICEDIENLDGFPTEVRGVSTLDTAFRDSQGRKWFRVLPDREPFEESDAGEEGDSEEEPEEEPEALACQYCGKPYKSEQWLRNHEGQCTLNPGE